MPEVAFGTLEVEVEKAVGRQGPCLRGLTVVNYAARVLLRAESQIWAWEVARAAEAVAMRGASLLGNRELRLVGVERPAEFAGRLAGSVRGLATAQWQRLGH